MKLYGAIDLHSNNAICGAIDSHDHVKLRKNRLFPNLSKVNVAQIAILAVSDAVPRVYGIC